MTKDQKQAELEKSLAITLATYNYLIGIYGRMIVCDDVSTYETSYNNAKARAVTYFKEGQLAKLKKQLKTETDWLNFQLDIEFDNYIKKNTGYSMDIFSNSRAIAEEVLERGAIASEKESQNISQMVRWHQKTAETPEKLKKLSQLLDDFYERKRKEDENLPKHQKFFNPFDHETEVTHLVERVEKDGIIHELYEAKVTTWNGPKPKHYKEREEIAPDGKHRLTITECTSGKHSSTTVSISFTEMMIQVYYATGIYPTINAFWKNNTTIVIETEKKYTTSVKYKKVENYGDVITIEYIES